MHLKVSFLLFFFFSICNTVNGQNRNIDSLNKPATVKTKEMKEKKIKEVVITNKKSKYKSKKENPAYAIMQKVWENKRKNGLTGYETYRYDEYEKISFDLNNIDSAFTKKKIFNKLEFIFDYSDSTSNGTLSLPIFLNESFYTVLGENRPNNQSKRTLIAQKTSGFMDNQVITSASKNLYRDIDIYDSTLNFFDIGFTSPVSSGGFSTYDYNLIDTVRIRGENAYKIQYQPKRSDDLAFQGYLYIHESAFSVLKVNLRSTKRMNVNFVNSVFAELEFDNPDEKTFLPVSVNVLFELSPFNKKKSSKGLIARRSVTYSKYQFNIPISKEDLKRKESDFDTSALNKNDAFWVKARPDSLSKSEVGVYKMLDQLQNTPKFNSIIKWTEVLSSGYYNLRKGLDIGPIFSIYGKNIVEGDRIRIGARTYFSQNDPWRVQFYTAYGFLDKKIKYGAEAKYMFNKVNRFTIGVGTRRDVVQQGVQLTNDDAIMSRSFASSAVFARGENASLSNVSQTTISTAIEPFKNFQIKLDATMESIQSANDQGFDLRYYKDNTLRKTVLDSRFSLSIIAKPGARFAHTGVERFQQRTLAPTIVLSYTKGISGLFNADFDYQKVQLLYTHPILIGNWGKTNLHTELGKNFNHLPIALLNVLPANQTYGLIANTFSQLNYYEFVTDAYATFHWEHHFNGKLFSYLPLIKKLKMRELVFFRAAYGTLSDETKNMNVVGVLYSAPDQQVYYEYGFGIENIGFGNLRIFRIDFNWRGNYLDRPQVSRFGIKAGIRIAF